MPKRKTAAFKLTVSLEGVPEEESAETFTLQRGAPMGEVRSYLGVHFEGSVLYCHTSGMLH